MFHSTTSVLSVHNNCYSPCYWITFRLTKAWVDRPKCRTNSFVVLVFKRYFLRIIFSQQNVYQICAEKSYVPKVVNLISRYERCREKQCS